MLSTFDMGQLVPVGHFDVLPGDSVRMATSALIRVSPLMAPVMHPVQVRVHHWFVPYRVLWDGWEDFITGQDETPPPQIVYAGTTPEKTLLDYMGLPPVTTNTIAVNAFPVLAYNKIFNEFYRDQDLQPEIAEDQITVQQCAWEKDYFTAARPWPQKGPDITIPLAGSAPVVPLGSGIPTFDGDDGLFTQKSLSSNSGQNGVIVQPAPNPTTTTYLKWNNPALEADMSATVAANVNDLRLAFALQRYQEARAQYGSRYTEYLAYLGIRSSDARLQRPEYLGGGRATINFSEVLRTGNESTQTGGEAPIGELRGHGISAVRSRRWVRFFEEHGVVIALASVRPRSIYANGVHRSWRKQTKEDFWQKELEQIGQQEVYTPEVYADTSDPTAVFGFQDRYSEYRHHPSYIAAEFRDVLNDWHLARLFASEPALNADFIQCVPSKRVHAEQTQNVLWSMFSHSIQARRMVSNRTIGRIF